MSADEIEYIMRIMYCAVNSGLPYVEDYYYQVQGGGGGAGGSTHWLLVVAMNVGVINGCNQEAPHNITLPANNLHHGHH